MSTQKNTTLMINDIMNQFRIIFQRDIEPGESDDKVFEKLQGMKGQSIQRLSLLTGLSFLGLNILRKIIKSSSVT